MNKYNFLGLILIIESFMYGGAYFGLKKFNNKFKTLTIDRRLYVVKNLVKSFVLACITIFGTPHFYNNFLESKFDNEIIYKFGALYVSNDIIALCVVKKLSLSTKLHHFITTLLLFYSFTLDFNNLENPGLLMYIYTILSSYSFLVNFYLGVRFLKEKEGIMANYIDICKIYAYYIYIISCSVNWALHLFIIALATFAGLISMQYVIYFILLEFIVYDDLVLLDWLRSQL